MLCVYGKEESSSLCRTAPRGLLRVVEREGGHRTRDDRFAASLVLGELGVPSK